MYNVTIYLVLIFVDGEGFHDLLRDFDFVTLIQPM